MKPLAKIPTHCPYCKTPHVYSFPSGTMQLWRFECGQQIYFHHVFQTWVLDDENLQGWGVCQRQNEHADAAAAGDGGG